jgi:hypothetical protein
LAGCKPESPKARKETFNTQHSTLNIQLGVEAELMPL